MKRIFRLWSRDPVRREVDEEIEVHLRLRAEALEREGLGPDEARREAERRFGDVARARRRLARGARRREAGLRWVGRARAVASDVGLALRQARRRPGATTLEVAIFALGVALTTATFTLVDRVLLRPLPLPDPHRLVSLQSVDSAGRAIARVSASNWYDWRVASRTLEASGLHDAGPAPVATDRGAVTVAAQSVAGGFFEAVGMPLVWGRTPGAEAMEAEPAVVVVTQGLWDRLVGGAPRAGRVLRVAGAARTVVGVVPTAAAYPPGTELWLPDRPTRGSGAMRNNINWYAVGRLREGASLDAAREELSAVARRIREEDSEALYSHAVEVRPLREFVVGGSRTLLWVLMGAGASVLLVASVNLAALNVARATATGRETAVRRALGAGRGRVVQQLTTRHLLVAVVAGGLGLLLAHAGTATVVEAAGLPLPRSPGSGVDGRIAAFGIGVSLLAGLVAGLLPALRASTASLGSGGRGADTRDRGARRVGALLVGVEVALSVFLVAGGGLLVLDLRTLLDRGLGFDADRVVVARTSLVEPDYREAPETRAAYWARVRDAVRALPGVEAAAVASTVPTGRRGNGFIEVEGWNGGTAAAAYQTVGEGYFDALSIRVRQGRVFGRRDGPGTGRVVVINRTMAERYWPGMDALGRRVKALSMESIGDPPSPWLTVIGVVDDIRPDGFASEPEPEMYVLFRQAPLYWTGNLSVVARIRGPATAAGVETVAEAVRRVDPRLAVDAHPLSRRVADLLSETRGLTFALTGFAVLATLLAGMGVYGLVSFTVTERTQEMGIRVALGARRREIVVLVVAGASRLAALAVALGLAAAWLLRSGLEPLLLGIEPTRTVPYAVAAAFLLGTAVAAALLPAWRAARTDPVRSLRDVAG